MKIPLKLVFVFIAFAAAAFALTPDWWKGHPISQFLWTVSGAISTTMLPRIVKNARHEQTTTKAGNYLLMLVACDFILRMLISPLLLAYGMRFGEESEVPGFITTICTLNGRVRDWWIPLILFAVAAYRTRSRLWKIAMGLLFVVQLGWIVFTTTRMSMLADGSLQPYASARFHTLVGIASVSVPLLILIIASSIDLIRVPLNRRISLHWLGVLLYGYWLGIATWATWRFL